MQTNKSRKWTEEIAATKTPKYIRWSIVFYTFLIVICGIQAVIFTLGFLVGINTAMMAAGAAMWWTFTITTWIRRRVFLAARRLQRLSGHPSKITLS
jgi:TRAP-type C4-dicarboxylate transport system permease large subunit